jgi:hypothetical protein
MNTIQNCGLDASTDHPANGLEQEQIPMDRDCLRFLFQILPGNRVSDRQSLALPKGRGMALHLKESKLAWKHVVRGQPG